MLHAIIELPGSVLTLAIRGFGVSETDLHRFGPVFISVWGKIHGQHRQAIERYWQSANILQPPCIELQVPWSDQQTLASTDDRGATVKFDWKSCALLPDNLLEVPIAHEMGHVYQWATDKNRRNMTPSDLLGIIELLPLRRHENTLVEIHADEMVVQWGFDPVSHAAFLMQHYDLKDGNYVKRSKPRNQKRAYNEAKEQRTFARYKL